jgi:hypothetical protein
MIRTAAGPTLASALRLVSSGTVDLDELAAGPAIGTAWTLDRDGQLTAPELECV